MKRKKYSEIPPLPFAAHNQGSEKNILAPADKHKVLKKINFAVTQKDSLGEDSLNRYIK